ncbi:MAG: helix-turn-helix domain-containing protein [Clostridia bacterium]
MTEAAAGPGESLGIGAALAQAREAQGLGHAEISQHLKFMPRQLEALENERFDLLPGPTIARGMVRTYARFLKLDPEPLLARMAGRVESHDATPELAARFQQPVPFADGGRRSTFVYLALSACVLAGGAAVLYQWRQEEAAPEFVAPAKQAVPPAQVASVAPAAPLAAPAEAPPKKAEVAPKKADVAPKKADAPKEADAAPVESKPEMKVADSAAPKSIGGGSQRIIFRFDEEAWIEVTDGAGRLLASSLNPAGSERVLQGKPPFNLVIGNASHVRLTYNDRDVDLQPHVRVEVARFTLP